MKYLCIFFIVLLAGCKGEEPELTISDDTKTERAATADSFVGTWEYVLDGSVYQRIVIDRLNSDYSFKNYVKLAGDFRLDTDHFHAQDIASGTFVKWDQSVTFHPYLTVKSASGTPYSLFFRVLSGRRFIELGLSKYYFVQ